VLFALALVGWGRVCLTHLPFVYLFLNEIIYGMILVRFSKNKRLSPKDSRLSCEAYVVSYDQGGCPKVGVEGGVELQVITVEEQPNGDVQQY